VWVVKKRIREEMSDEVIDVEVSCLVISGV
jgi:hypothetical protein